VANFLAQQGKKVAIVEMLDSIGLDMDSYVLKILRAELAERNVKILTSLKIDEVTDQGVILIDRDWNRTLHRADSVVLALGQRPNHALAEELAGKVKTISVIGDARLPRKIKDAISEGFLTAYHL